MEYSDGSRGLAAINLSPCVGNACYAFSRRSSMFSRAVTCAGECDCSFACVRTDHVACAQNKD